MAQTKTISKTQVRIKEFLSAIRPSVFVAEKTANHKDSMAFLFRNDLRPMTYQEALFIIDKDAGLKALLKGHWFYLDGKGFKEAGHYTFDKQGKLKNGVANPEKTVNVSAGSNPLSFYVNTDEDVHAEPWRFTLDAWNRPEDVASRVVGIKIGQEVTALKAATRSDPILAKSILTVDLAVSKLENGESLDKTEIASLRAFVESMKRQEGSGY